MKKKAFSPHISRLLPAGPVLWLGKTLFLAVLTGFLLISALTIFFPENLLFSRLKEQLLSQPFSALTHLKLGQHYLRNGANTLAEQEFIIAQQLATIKEKNSNILGEATNLLDQTRQGPQLLEQQLNQWKEVIKEKPDYRDAYIQLATLAYQLKRLEQAKSYIDKALNLDPNFEPAKKLQELLNRNQESGIKNED